MRALARRIERLEKQQRQSKEQQREQAQRDAAEVARIREKLERRVAALRAQETLTTAQATVAVRASIPDAAAILALPDNHRPSSST